MSADISTLSPQAVLSADKAGRFGKVVCNSGGSCHKGVQLLSFWGKSFGRKRTHALCQNLKGFGDVWQIGGCVGIDLWGDGLNDERCLGDDFARIKQEGWHLTERINGGQLGRIFLR